MVIPYDEDKAYFVNVQLEHLVVEFVRGDELDGTVVNAKTIITSPMKACELTKIKLVLWQVLDAKILLGLASGGHQHSVRYPGF